MMPTPGPLAPTPSLVHGSTSTTDRILWWILPTRTGEARACFEGARNGFFRTTPTRRTAVCPAHRGVTAIVSFARSERPAEGDVQRMLSVIKPTRDLRCRPHA